MRLLSRPLNTIVPPSLCFSFPVSISLEAIFQVNEIQIKWKILLPDLRPFHVSHVSSKAINFIIHPSLPESLLQRGHFELQEHQLHECQETMWMWTVLFSKGKWGPWLNLMIEFVKCSSSPGSSIHRSIIYTCFSLFSVTRVRLKSIPAVLG